MASSIETAVQQFDANIDIFRAALNIVAVSVGKEREALQLEKERLDQQRREFEEEQAMVTQVRQAIMLKANDCKS